MPKRSLDLPKGNKDNRYGQTIHDLDDFMLIAGKKFLQEVMQQKLQERIKQAEQ